MKNIVKIALFIMLIASCGQNKYEYQSLEKNCSECIEEIQSRQLMDEINGSGIQTESTVLSENCALVFSYIKKYNNVTIYPIEGSDVIRAEFEKAKENEINSK